MGTATAAVPITSRIQVCGLVVQREHSGSEGHEVPLTPEIRKKLGVPNVHLHDLLPHTGNTLAAQSGASLRDLMARMGHDSPAAALIYQHSSRVADEAIAAALDVNLAGRARKSESEEGPAWGPALQARPIRIRSNGARLGEIGGADDENRTRMFSLGIITTEHIT